MKNYLKSLIFTHLNDEIDYAEYKSLNHTIPIIPLFASSVIDAIEIPTFLQIEKTLKLNARRFNDIHAFKMIY